MALAPNTGRRLAARWRACGELKSEFYWQLQSKIPIEAPMNIEHMRTFLEVAATANFNRAAERLNVSQSTVSARIRALEQQLDRRLLVRARSGAELTAAGRQFQRHALTAVRAWQQARQQIALPDGLRTAFAIGIQVNLWERLIPVWLGWMRREAADVALRIEADYSDSLTRQLIDGLLDLGVMYVPRTTPGLVIEPLLDERLILVATEPRTVRQGWREDYVLVHWGDDFQAAHSQAFPDMLTPTIAVGLGAIGLRTILDNGGSGYFLESTVRHLIARRRLHRVANAPTFRRPAFLVYPANPVEPDLLQLALEGLRLAAAGHGG
jgi:DNA-binding transcriptional LysR family regulator